MMWKRLSLRSRAVLWVVALQLATLVVLNALYLSHARVSIVAEQEAGHRAARDMVISSVGALLREGDQDLIARLSQRIAPLRHVRIRFFDAKSGEYPAKKMPQAAPVPQLVTRMLSPPVKQQRIPLADRGRTLGVVWIEGDPARQIARVWREVIWLAGGSVLALMVTGGLLFWMIDRALTPITALQRGLEKLAAGDLSTRIPVPASPDLAPIGAEVNRLAQSLDQAEAARQDLSRQLTDLQEEERKRIAMELHDEMGPYLFGLTAQADRLAHVVPENMRAQVESLQEIAGQMRQINRRVLAALRPMTVGQLPLADIIRDLLDSQRAWMPGLQISLDLGPLPETNETQDLTLYRFVQEAVTNTHRHADASRVEVRLTTDQGQIVASVEDDGKGIGTAPRGTGLRGMQERLHVQGGTLTIGASRRGGTLLTARLPLEAP